jgi:hypothetical protein
LVYLVVSEVEMSYYDTVDASSRSPLMGPICRKCWIDYDGAPTTENETIPSSPFALEAAPCTVDLVTIQHLGAFVRLDVHEFLVMKSSWSLTEHLENIQRKRFQSSWAERRLRKLLSASEMIFICKAGQLPYSWRQLLASRA